MPATALATTGALTLAVAVWAARRADGLPLLVSIVDVGALAAFTMLHASVVGYFVVGRHHERRLWHLLVPLTGAVVTLWVLAEASLLAQTTVSRGQRWARSCGGRGGRLSGSRPPPHDDRRCDNLRPLRGRH